MPIHEQLTNKSREQLAKTIQKTTNKNDSRTAHKNKVLAVRNCYKAYTIRNKVIAGERND